MPKKYVRNAPPEHPSYVVLNHAHPVDGKYATVPINSSPRTLLKNVVQLGAHFNDDYGQRRELGHDCSVFAFEYLTGQSLLDTRFGNPGTAGVTIEQYTSQFPYTCRNASDLTQFPIGSVIMTTNGEAWSPGLEDFTGVNMLIRASVDNGPTIFVTKPTIEQPVMAMDVATILHNWPATQAIGIARLAIGQRPFTG